MWVGVKVVVAVGWECEKKGIKANQNKSNLFFSSMNNTQYKSIDLKYEIPLLKEWMVRQADINTIAEFVLLQLK